LNKSTAIIGSNTQHTTCCLERYDSGQTVWQLSTISVAYWIITYNSLSSNTKRDLRTYCRHRSCSTRARPRRFSIIILNSSDQIILYYSILIQLLLLKTTVAVDTTTEHCRSHGMHLCLNYILYIDIRPTHGKIHTYRSEYPIQFARRAPVENRSGESDDKRLKNIRYSNSRFSLTN